MHPDVLGAASRMTAGILGLTGIPDSIFFFATVTIQALFGRRKLASNGEFLWTVRFR